MRVHFGSLVGFALLHSLPLVAGCVIVGCNVLRSFENCIKAADCALGDVCNADEHFCELDRGPILLGAPISLTGDLRESGGLATRGLVLAEAEINAAGGVLERTIQIKIVDDESDVGRARARTAELITVDRVAALVGPLSSPIALKTQEISYAEQVLHVSPNAGALALSFAQPENDRFFFRTVTTNGTSAGITLLARELNGGACKRLALLYSDDTIGHAYRDAMTALFTKAGGCIVASVPYPPPKQVNYEAQLKELLAPSPDCVQLTALPASGAEILREFHKIAAADSSGKLARIPWLGGNALRADDLLQAARVNPQTPVPSEAEGLYVADSEAEPPTPAYRNFRVVYNNHFMLPLETPVPPIAKFAYDSAVLVSLAIQSAGSVSNRVRIRDGFWAVVGEGPDHHAYGPTELREALAAVRRGNPIHYVGASSKLIFDARGTIISEPIRALQVQNGAFEVVRHFDDDEIAAFIRSPDAPDPSCK